MRKSQIKDILEDISALKSEDQSYIVKVVKKRLVEKKRQKLINLTKQAISDYSKGNIKKGSVADFWKDIDGSDSLDK